MRRTKLVLAMVVLLTMMMAVGASPASRAKGRKGDHEE